MTRLKLTATCAALLMLAGCDLVRVPEIGSENGTDSAPVTAPDSDAPAPPTQDEGAPTDDAASNKDTDASPDDVESAIDAPDELAPETPDTADETDEQAPTDPEMDDTTEAADDSAEAISPALSLGLLNAKICGTDPDAIPTPTVANVAGATTIEEPTVGTAAVNALAATLPSFPGIVKLEPRNTSESGAVSSGHCGATRIAQNWFVTAAHCVDEPYEELRLIGESANLRSPLAKTTKGQFAVCHAGYKGTANGYANDLALIRVSDEDAETLANVPIAKFGQTTLPLSPIGYKSGDMAGWGLTRYGGQLSNELLTTFLDLSTIGPAIITVASRNGAGPCIGDSGGPLYVTEADGTKTLVGVLSVVEQNQTTGEFCAGDYNGRYTNLQGFDDWIQSVMTLCETNPETCR